MTPARREGPKEPCLHTHTPANSECLPESRPVSEVLRRVAILLIKWKYSKLTSNGNFALQKPRFPLASLLVAQAHAQQAGRPLPPSTCSERHASATDRQPRELPRDACRHSPRQPPGAPALLRAQREGTGAGWHRWGTWRMAWPSQPGTPEWRLASSSGPEPPGPSPAHQTLQTVPKYLFRGDLRVGHRQDLGEQTQHEPGNTSWAGHRPLPGRHVPGAQASAGRLLPTPPVAAGPARTITVAMMDRSASLKLSMRCELWIPSAVSSSCEPVEEAPCPPRAGSGVRGPDMVVPGKKHRSEPVGCSWGP